MEADELEGADMLMVKPAGPYLDVIRAVWEATHLPVAAYQVSGEYAMLMAASERGWLDGSKSDSRISPRDSQGGCGCDSHLLCAAGRGMVAGR